MKYIYLVAVGTFIMLSCSQEKKVVKKKNSQEIIMGIERDTMSIKLNDTSLNNYHTQVSFSWYKNDFLIGYNDKTHCLDVFNFTNKDIFNIELNIQGRGAVAGEVNGLYATSLDSLWILANQTVYLLDSIGIIQKQYDLMVDEGEYIINTSNYSNASVRLYFDTDKCALYYATIKMGDKNAFYINILSLNDGRHKKIELKYTDTEQGVGQRYGWMQHPNITYNYPLVIYNFPFNSNVYTMDLNTDVIKSYGGESRYTPNIASEVYTETIDSWYKHMIENVHFYEVNYDPYRKRYYRLHLNGVDFNSTISVSEQIFDKQMFLTVFDQEFNVIEEFPLSNDLYNINGGWGVFKNGLFIIKDNPNMEHQDYECLKYDILCFN